jgi:hypothetical protein
VSQIWKGCKHNFHHHETDDVTLISIDYINMEGQVECLPREQVPCGEVATYTTQCTEGMAVVDLYLYDQDTSIFAQADEKAVAVPMSCSSYGDNNKTCHLRYIVDCVPTICIEEERKKDHGGLFSFLA